MGERWLLNQWSKKLLHHTNIVSHHGPDQSFSLFLLSAYCM